ncbi:hypothetical protein AB0D38_02955 [Streptomyces sp. NPDC048279]|uniref:hypothetical protein n=1 Tax=Streptomyces sp. NPDC048279 TaxID=3154714 RepID=UPI00342C3AF4
MKPVQPNPYSPYATADAGVRHLFPTLFGPPAAGALLPAGCLGLAVVPDEVIEIDPAATDLPAGLCPGCVAALRGIAVVAPRTFKPCRNCKGHTRHNELCAVCRAEAHELWAATRVAVPPPPTAAAGPYVVMGGPINVTPAAFCEHGDLAFHARMKVRALRGDQDQSTLDLVLPRCYLAKVFGAVLAVVDHDSNPEAHDRFTHTVNHTQDLARRSLQERAARREREQ